VTFKDGAISIGSGTLSAGSATFSTSSLAVGTHTITVSYAGDTNFTASTSANLLQTVNQDGSTTTVTSSANPSVFGQTVTFTATVSAVTPGSGTPTGTVTFKDGAISIGSGTLSAGSATLSTSSLSVGTHTITVSYVGDTNFTASTSASLQQTVNQDGSTTTVTSSVNPSVFGQTVMFRATVSALAPGAGTPTGIVTFKDGGVSIGSGTLSAGSATFSTSSLSVGTHTITVSYAGDTNFTASTSAHLLQTVNQDGSTTTVTSSVNPSVFGQTVTFTATVSAVTPGSGTPTGTVTFKDGGVSIGSGTLLAGSATFSTSSLAVRTHTITVSYAGDTNFTASTSANLLQTVNQDGSTTTVTSSVNPSVFGQVVTFMATVSAVAPGAGTPTGTATFLDGATTLGTASLSAGSATYATSALAVGNHVITVSYGGDGNFNSSTSGVLTQTVNQAPTTSTVSVSAPTQQYSDLETFTATLSPASINGLAPASNVAFYVSYGSGSYLLVGTVNNDGSNTHFTPVPAGTSTITSSWSTTGGIITATLANVPLLADVAGPSASDGSGKMAPGAHTVKAVFGGVNPNFIVGTPTTALTINPEDARSYYTGDLFVSTSSVTSSTATVVLSATIKDITAVTGDPASDPYAGDIRNAQVTFINRDTNTPIATGLPISLVSSTDTKVGTVSYNWSVNIGSANSVSYTVGIVVTNYYSRNSSDENSVVTVSLPLTTGFITGGGYLVESSSAGAYAATAGTKNNFGFNVQFNKSGTTLHGNFNSIVRSGGHDYQIKSNSITSLSIVGTSLNRAIFDAKANLTDITDPNNTISLGGNLTLHATLTDNGNPTTDTIAITLWNGSTLLFSSNWNGTTTIEQLLGGGNLVVHHAQLVAGGAVNGPGSTQVLIEQMLRPVVTEAIAEWQAAGVPASALATLKDTDIEIADLPGDYLGWESANGVILIDSNAAGYGWFVDPSGAAFRGTLQGPAAGQLDLLTVVAHEFGHVLGIAELSDPRDLMYVYLPPGVRRVPTDRDVVAAGLPVVHNADLASRTGPGNQLLVVGPQLPAADMFDQRQAVDLVLSAVGKAPILPAATTTSVSTALPNPLLLPLTALNHERAIDSVLGELRLGTLSEDLLDDVALGTVRK
jgi:hypothetical protein